MKPLIIFSYSPFGSAFFKDLIYTSCLATPLLKLSASGPDTVTFTYEKDRYHPFKKELVKTCLSSNKDLNLKVRDIGKFLDSGNTRRYGDFPYCLVEIDLMSFDYDTLKVRRDSVLSELIKQSVELEFKMVDVMFEDYILVAISRIFLRRFRKLDSSIVHHFDYPAVKLQEDEFVLELNKLLNVRKQSIQYLESISNDRLFKFNSEIGFSSQRVAEFDLSQLSAFLCESVESNDLYPFRTGYRDLEFKVVNIDRLRYLGRSAVENLGSATKPPPKQTKKRQLEKVAVVTNNLTGLEGSSFLCDHFDVLIKDIQSHNIDLRVYSTYDESPKISYGSAWYWENFFKTRGIQNLLPPPSTIVGEYPSELKQSFRIFKELAIQQFDWVHFDDADGLAYCSLASRKFFPNTVITCSALAPKSWIQIYNKPSHKDIFSRLLQEISYKLADGFIGVSDKTINWIAEILDIPIRFSWTPGLKPLNLFSFHNQPLISKIFFLQTMDTANLFSQVVSNLPREISVEIIDLGKVGTKSSSETDSFINLRSLIEHICSLGALPVISPSSIDSIIAINELRKVNYPTVTLSSCLHNHPPHLVSDWNCESLVSRINYVFETQAREPLESILLDSSFAEWKTQLELIKEKLPNYRMTLDIQRSDDEILEDIMRLSDFGIEDTINSSPYGKIDGVLKRDLFLGRKLNSWIPGL